MNSKWHLVVSSVKSLIRIIAGVISVLTQDVVVLAIGIVVAELLGIIEELGDER